MENIRTKYFFIRKKPHLIQFKRIREFGPKQKKDQLEFVMIKNDENTLSKLLCDEKSFIPKRTDINQNDPKYFICI